MKALSTLLAAVLLPLLASAAPAWNEILGPSQGTIPPPAGFGVEWRTDLQAALKEAQQDNRPVFVTLRCLPCKQCSKFDKDVLEGGPTLTPLLNQFVTVRLTDASFMDLRLLPIVGFQDLDMSWWGYFLSPQGQVYGVYGGRDHVSDETRISEKSLENALTRVLRHHYDPRRESWAIDGPIPDLGGKPKSPRTLPGYQSWFEHSGPGVKQQVCIHCHQVNDILRTPAVNAGTFDKHNDFDVWPLPENVGIQLDRDNGLKVLAVKAGSPAAKAGIKSGDVLGAAEGRRLFGQADFRGALHRGPKQAGTLEVEWLRGDNLISGNLSVEPGWRKTILDWRITVSQGIVGGYLGFFPINTDDGKRKRYGLTSGSMAMTPFLGKKEDGPAYLAGLRPNHVITAVDGNTEDITGRSFLVWFVMNYEPGDPIRLTVKDDAGKTRNITYTVPPKPRFD